MSLYWQQAVQNRGTAPQQGAQSHGHSQVDVNGGQWQNVNLGANQTNYWSQEPVNTGSVPHGQQNSHHAQQQYAQQHGQQYQQPAHQQGNSHAGYVQQHNYQNATPSNSNGSIQHTPLLNTQYTHANIPVSYQYNTDGSVYPSYPQQNYGASTEIPYGYEAVCYDSTSQSAVPQPFVTSQPTVPQVPSLTSIPEFETVEFPAAAVTTDPSVPVVPALIQESQYPQVDLPVEATPKQSSQVTPESTYSVDTFGSGPKEQEKAKEDEWDDWEQTPREEHEKSHEGGSTVSEPVLMLHSDRSRETSVASAYELQQNGYEYNNHETEKPVDAQPVAQVAPLIKNHVSEAFEQPVARVGPVSQTVDQASNVGRVAPTRPVQASPAPIPTVSDHQVNEWNEPTPPPVSAVSSVPSVEAHSAGSHGTIPNVVAEVPLVAPRPVELETTPPLDSTDNHLNVVQPDVDRVTPDNAVVLNGDSPGEAQATSTPLAEHLKEERITERRSSVSSVRSAVVIPPNPPSIANGEQSDSTQGSLALIRGGVRGSYQERYRTMREKYVDSRTHASPAMQRFDQRRSDTPRTMRGNPLADMSVGGRRSALQVSSRAGNKVDPSNSSFSARDQSMYSHADASLDQSIDLGRGQVGYGEDFVDASRRSRLNRSRPPSRAKSDVGDDGHFHRGHGMPHGGHHNRYPSDMGYPGQHQYYGYLPMARHGRMSAVPYPTEYHQQNHYLAHRPQSTVDPRYMERYGRQGGNNYDVYGHGPAAEDLDESFSEESEMEDEQGESDDEMRNYMPHPMNNTFSSYSMASQHQRRGMAFYGNQELYYFGLIRQETSKIDHFLRRNPPPREFYAMEPMEKVAYLYFAVVYNKLFPQGVTAFRNMFKREFYNYRCNGDHDNAALIKVCNSMMNEFNMKRQNSQQKAYEASQKQLFSDDRDSADGLSDRASVYDKDDDVSDIMSVDTSQKAPLKHRTPHAFVTFGPGGKKVTVQPDLSVSVVYVDDVRNVLRDNHSRRIIDAAHNFKGPLIPGRTAPHSITLYIKNQISHIRHSEVAQENPNSCDVVDCLLLWQLLEMVVQQQGRVTGPDIARLLISAGASSSKRAHSNHREKSATPSLESTKSGGLVDPKAFERFTQFLLGGHVDEAVECAMRDGLYADAMVLVRRIYSGDERKLAEIEARFLTTRPTSNPVMTLVSVASGQPAPVLSNPPIDDAGSWRSHAAIVLANLNSTHALETVYRLGRVLAKREYHAAADFCFLAVTLLSNFEGINVFQPLPKSDDGNERQYVSLIHASLPDDEWNNTTCRFSFSLMDLHATEIFDYAIRLSAAATFVSPLQSSVEYQRRRLQYSQLLAGFGGFNTEAFKYLLNIASSIWNNCSMFAVSELTLLADLADSLRLYTTADAADTTWIESLRSMTQYLVQNPPAAVAAPVADSNSNTQQEQLQGVEQSYYQGSNAPSASNTECNATQGMSQTAYAEPEFNPMKPRSRTESLAIEARDWHEEHQDPIQMSPRTSTVTPSHGEHDMTPAGVYSPLDNYATPRDRADSHTSHTSRMSYGEQLCRTQQKQYAAANDHHGYEEDSTTDSAENSTSHESTPVRQQRDTISSSASTTTEQPQWQPAVIEQPPQVHHQPAYQPPVPQAPPPTPQQQQQPAASSAKPAGAPPVQPQVNGLKRGGNNSSGVFSSFINKVRTAIPGNNEMKLPDDRAPTIQWDAAAGKWVGDGVEAETVAAPPPKMDVAAPPVLPSGGGLRAARGGGGSRYFNPLADTNNSSAAPVPVPVAPPTLPMSFSFIPTMPDDGDAAVDPFSGEANPTVHGADHTSASG